MLLLWAKGGAGGKRFEVQPVCRPMQTTRLLGLFYCLALQALNGKYKFAILCSPSNADPFVIAFVDCLQAFNGK